MCKRLFVGIEAHEQALYDSAMALKARLPGKYHPLANYHVTLAFIGAYEEAPVAEALNGIAPQGSVTLETLPAPGFFGTLWRFSVLEGLARSYGSSFTVL